MIKTTFIVIAFLFISTPINLVARDLGPYVEEYSRLIEAGKHNESIVPASEIINKFEAIKQLVEFHHADINIRDNEGDTPLGYAKHKGNSSIEQYLKRNGGKL